MTAPIVAAADGSEASLAATHWAAVVAARRGVPLSIVHVMDQQPGPSACARLVGYDLRHDLSGLLHHELPHHARSVLARASHRAIAAAPGVDLRAVAIYGQADRVLAGITTRAPLLAVGRRGAGGLPGLGSVARWLAGRARCPVVFATAGGCPVFGEVVVGTDGSDAAAALEFGFGEADARDARLTALHVWTSPRGARLESFHDWMMSVGPPNADAAAVLSGQVAPWRRRYPGVLVTESTVHGQPGRVLAMASGHADLVVVAGHPAGPAPGPGPVAEALLPHAQCPVAVIPDGARVAPVGLLAARA